MTLYSRPSSDPTFSNHPSTDFHADQLFYFIWEEVIVEKVEFDLAAGKILSSETITLAEQVLTNNSDKEEDLSFSINKSVTRSSTFEYGSGFTVTPGTEFSGEQNPICRLSSAQFSDLDLLQSVSRLSLEISSG